VSRPGAALFLGILGLVLLSAAGSAGLVPIPTPQLYPQVPAQPGAPAPAGCTLPANAPGTWSMISNSAGNGYPMQHVVDPGAPCVIYRTVDPHTVERSTDHGRTWSTVFHDDAPMIPPTTSQFWGSHTVVPQSGHVVVTDWGNGDGVVASADSGNSWTLKNQGIAGRKVIRENVARADPNVAYVVLAAPQDAHPGGPTSDNVRGLAVTGDGGASWSLLNLPLDGTGPASQPAQHTTVPALVEYQLLVAIDPRDAGHVWLGELPPIDTTLASSPTSSTRPWFFFESHDRGNHWQRIGVLPAGTAQLEVIHSARHPLRLVASGMLNAGYGVAVSDDDGTSWRPILSGQGVVRPRPSNPDEVLVMLYTGRGWTAGYSVDGLDNVVSVPAPQVPLSAQLPSGSPSQGGGVSTGAMWGFEPGDLVAVDDRGSFYASFACSSQSASVCPGGGSTSSFSLWEFTPPTPAQIRFAPPAGQRPAALWTRPPAPPPLPTVNGCALPVPQPAGASGTSAISSGSLAFDGHELLYTHYLESGPQDFQAVIHTMDPLTCAKHPDILVSFDPVDAAAWDAANAPAHLRQPWIDDMTYDARRNVLWATVDDTVTDSSAGSSSNASIGLFTVRVTDAATNPRRAVAHLAFLSGCGHALTYDQTRDVIWSCSGQGPTNAIDNWAQLNTQTGYVVPSCADAIPNNPTNTVLVGVGAWTTTAPDRLYTWNEDDTTFTEYETATCQPVAAFSHRPVVEPTAEDEQIACDTVSFATDSAQPQAPHGVLWMRDAGVNTASSYAITDGYCPVQTVTSLHAPTQLLTGVTTPICVDLQHLYLSGSLPIQARPIELSVQGPVSAGLKTAATTVQGRCVPWTPGIPGRYTITATFDAAMAGMAAEYLPSSAATIVTVLGVGGSTVALPRPLVALVGPPPGPPAPPISSGGGAPAPAGSAQVSVASHVQAQAQSQSQAQAQSVTQVQPGVMVQRQQRTQIAVQQQSASNTVYEASALSLAMGLLLTRRPRWARAALTSRATGAVRCGRRPARR